MTSAECKMQSTERKTAGGLRLGSALVAVMVAILLAGCGTTAKRDASASREPATRSGGYYLDDGPGAGAPANIDAIPDAVPKVEPLQRGTMRPYAVMGRSYTPMTELTPYKARGVASWYGRRYHGKKTSSGEFYDMYAMTAAHTELPIPSYVRVTNVANGKSVVVRVNDRGPFIDSRLIDLSYTAAHKLGIIGAGSGLVEVESIIPGMTPPPAPPVATAPAPAVSTSSAAAPGAVATAVAIASEPASVVAAAPPPAPPASAPAPAVTGGSFIQFGAFGVRENAESYLTRLQTQTEWLNSMLRITHSDGIYRVQAGPYATEAAAREAAERAGQLLGMKPVVIAR